MLKAAVNGFPGSAGDKKAGLQQQSLNSAFKQPSQQKFGTGTRPLSTMTGNVLKHDGAGERRTSPTRGIKRSSSGLAKRLESREDAFEYPGINISENGFDLSRHAYVQSNNQAKKQADVFFDENDFDSDIDLDLEDPATKSTVTYPTLPPMPRDSAYRSLEPDSQLKKDPISSQAVPWSSSPPEHFKTPPKVAESKKAAPTKRRTLPWLDKQNQAKREASQMLEEEQQSSSEGEPANPNKRRSVEAKQGGDYTPLPKDTAKQAYAWNTTASAVKQQQKSLREANKKLSKANEGTDDDVANALAKKKKNTVHRIFLSEEQQHVLNLVVEYKKSVFFTGSAGTGKSVLLREIITALRKKFLREPDRVAVTASTGLAACNIGGVTLHSFSGIGLGKESAEDLIKKIRRNPKAKQRWMRTKVLVIDEVSMVDGDLFDKLEQIARTIRNNGRPFGGIQLIITGDFFQLPPVPDHGRQAKFAFDAGSWTTSVEHTIGLHHVFRQKDPVFANMLNEMREGRMTPQSIAKFKSLDRPLPVSDTNIEATELFPTRQEVDRANTIRMQQLHGDVFTFDARDGGSIVDKTQRDRLLQSCMVPETVHLKKGAQVMLVKNMDDTLVNGSLGKVTGFMTEQMFTQYKENEDAFVNGEVGELGPTEAEVRAQQKASILGVNTQQVYPIVRFAIADGTTRDLLCKRESWKVELPNGEVQASREQIPLILAWALSIHKAQGQTLERVRVDLGRVFEKGQAYVALSRATNMGGLQVLRFDARKVLAHDKVRSFYAGLTRAEAARGKVEKGTVVGKLMKGQKGGD